VDGWAGAWFARPRRKASVPAVANATGTRSQLSVPAVTRTGAAANSTVPHNALHDARALRDHILSLE